MSAGAIFSFTLATALVTPEREVCQPSYAEFYACHITLLLSLTLATPLALIAITEFAGLVGAGRSTRGHNGAVKAGLSDNVDLNGGVTAGVIDRAGVNLGDRHLVGSKRRIGVSSVVVSSVFS